MKLRSNRVIELSVPLMEEMDIQVSSKEDCEKLKEDEPILSERILLKVLPYLQIPIGTRALGYLIIVFFLSTIGEEKEQRSNGNFLGYLIGKRSVFNQVFVKFGWAWTMAAILFQKVSCILVHGKGLKIFINLCMRLLLLTFGFYLCCHIIFTSVESLTGHCVNKGISIGLTKSACVKRKFQFFSFDISGHSFLLPYCCLILMEECKELCIIMRVGSSLRRSSDKIYDLFSIHFNVKLWSNEEENEQIKSMCSENVLPEFDKLEKNYFFSMPFVVTSSLSITLLCMIWEFMLVVTMLCYHTYSEKILGCCIGVLVWALFYQIFFKLLNIL